MTTFCMDEYKELFTCQLSKVEGLARRLLDREHRSPGDLWAIQIDLAHLQLSIHEEIKKQKFLQEEIKNKIDSAVRSREEGWKEALQKFQSEIECSEMHINIHKHALVLTKQLGDTLAWLLFKGDDNKIFSLAINQPNPPIPSGVSLKAMLAVAESYANAGAGFPIIHDITNCLRVGDLTFVDVLNEEDEPLTVEVKAKTLSTEEGKAHLEVTIYAIAHSPKFVAASAKLQKIPVKLQEPISVVEAAAEKTVETSQERPNSEHSGGRLSRQVRRMSRAKILQNARHLEPIESIDGDVLKMPLLPVQLKMQRSWFHWKLIRELTEKAKVNGCATSSVDDAFFYAVTYTDSPTIYPWSSSVDLPYANEISEGVVRAFPFCVDGENDCICFKSTWDYLSDDVPVYVRPFFLYEIPVDMRLDIMWRRLSIIVYINIGKVVEALEKVGISARVPTSERELDELFIPLTYQETLSNGSVVHIQGGSVNDSAAKIAFEFMSLGGFVECVLQTMKALVEIAGAKGDVETI